VLLLLWDTVDNPVTVPAQPPTIQCLIVALKVWKEEAEVTLPEQKQSKVVYLQLKPFGL